MTDPTFASVIRRAIDNRLLDLHVQIPGRIERYDAELQQADVTPLIFSPAEEEDATITATALPVIPNVPVAFPAGGGMRITLPMAKGDIVTLWFSEASLDRWLARDGEAVDPGDFRRHEMSDAIAYPGLRTFKNPLKSAPTDALSLGNDNGGPTIEIKAATIEAGGTAPLATKDDIDSLQTGIDSHIHTTTATIGAGPGLGVISPPTAPMPTAAGTGVLLGS